MHFRKLSLTSLVLAQISHLSAQAVNPATPAKAAAGTNAPVPTLPVRAYHIEGNTVLSPAEFGMLSNYTGTNITFPQLREGLGKLQLRYSELGFSTINVTLPQQKPTNGVIRVKIIEGRLSDIVVRENHYFSSNNVMRALPSLQTNILLNTKWFQPELDQANANRDRQIYPVISPGPEPGTTELELKVKDQLPLHGRVEVNNKSTPGTPLLRLDTAIQYNNLWQLDHQIGVDYNFSPQSYKSGNDAPTILDDPMVASYSGFYRLPLGSAPGFREQSDQQPVTFGYDEVSHKFNVPPPTGRPDLIVYASRSVSDTPVNGSGFTNIFSSSLIDVTSENFAHTYTENNNVGTKLTLPVPVIWSITSSLQLGVDYKSYNSKSYSTNVYNVNLYSIDNFGNRVLTATDSTPLPANSSQSLYYFPLSIGWSAVRPDKYGAFIFNWNQSIFLQALASPRQDFQEVAANQPGVRLLSAGGNYTTLNAGLTRQQNLGNWTATLTANGQWASAPLISNEQFALGGTSGVRGFQEGEAYGDNGWRVLFDLRTPPVNVGNFPTEDGDVPAQLRGSVFTDYGQISFVDRPNSSELSEWGAGFGAFLTVGQHFDARLTLAWALNNVAASSADHANGASVATQAGNVLAYFTVGFQF
jgi:hemolysin activation/secretion protein